jgi:hypothetical protein
MNEFDLLLEFQLRRLLGPVVAAPVPVRRKPRDLRRTDDALRPGQAGPLRALMALSADAFS